MTGRVYLVGGGPGDPGLLTVRAAELLATADAIVIDALISDEIRAMINPSAEIIDAGKRAGAHSMSQEQISERLVELARGGRVVVRLKGGDPFVFGRGGEEADELRRAGIPFDVVPGVTAGIAGPAYAGIPVTQRSLATSVTLITGHESEETSGVEWEALARLNGTIVFYMGLSRLPVISSQLVAAGMASSTPVAVISRATTTHQRTVRATLATIESAARDAALEAPALIVVGRVVELAESIAWFESRPLLGRTIVVTRARSQASDLAGRLVSMGARVLQFPMIEIQPPESWESLDAVVDDVERLGWVVFSSSNGVEAFFARLEEAGKDARSLHAARIAAVGAATAAALRQRGLLVDVIPEKYQSAALLPLLPPELPGVRVGVVRAESGNDELLDELRSRGALVSLGVAYRTVGVAQGRDELMALLRTGGVDAVTFTSGSTVEHFCTALGADPGSSLRDVRLISIGPLTTRAAEAAGLRIDATADEASVGALADTVRRTLIPARG